MKCTPSSVIASADFYTSPMMSQMFSATSFSCTELGYHGPEPRISFLKKPGREPDNLYCTSKASPDVYRNSKADFLEFCQYHWGYQIQTELGDHFGFG